MFGHNAWDSKTFNASWDEGQSSWNREPYYPPQDWNQVCQMTNIDTEGTLTTTDDKLLFIDCPIQPADITVITTIGNAHSVEKEDGTPAYDRQYNPSTIQFEYQPDFMDSLIKIPIWHSPGQSSTSFIGPIDGSDGFRYNIRSFSPWLNLEIRQIKKWKTDSESSQCTEYEKPYTWVVDETTGERIYEIGKKCPIILSVETKLIESTEDGEQEIFSDIARIPSSLNQIGQGSYTAWLVNDIYGDGSSITGYGLWETHTLDDALEVGHNIASKREKSKEEEEETDETEETEETDETPPPQIDGTVPEPEEEEESGDNKKAIWILAGLGVGFILLGWSKSKK
jgi:hypothetical protein